MVKNHCVLCGVVLSHSGIMCDKSHNPQVGFYNFFNADGSRVNLKGDGSHLFYVLMMKKEFGDD